MCYFHMALHATVHGVCLVPDQTNAHDAAENAISDVQRLRTLNWKRQTYQNDSVLLELKNDSKYSKGSIVQPVNF